MTRLADRSALMGHAQGLVATIAEGGPELFEVRGLPRAGWRPLQDAEFALARVICEAGRR